VPQPKDLAASLDRAQQYKARRYPGELLSDADLLLLELIDSMPQKQTGPRGSSPIPSKPLPLPGQGLGMFKLDRAEPIPLVSPPFSFFPTTL